MSTPPTLIIIFIYMALWDKAYPINYNQGGDTGYEGFVKVDNEFGVVYNRLNELRTARAGTSPPTDAEVNELWLDTSVNPPLLKRFDGTNWIPLDSDTLDTYHASQTPQPDVIPVTDANGVLNRGFVPYFVGFKNRVINGDFQIWQRGTSATGVTIGYFTADRWSIRAYTGSFDLSKSSMNGWNSLKVTTNTVADLSVSANYVSPYDYRFEGQHLYDINKKGSNITISFLFRSNVTGTFCVALCNADSSGNITESYVHEFQYATAGTAQKVVFTVPFARNFASPLRNDNITGILMRICTISGTNYQTSTTDTWISGYYFSTPNAVNWASSAGNYVEIAQVQVEEGDTATDFEFVPYDIQLLRCMRYYQKYGIANGNWAYIWSGATLTGFSGSDNNKRRDFLFPVRMRTTPTIIQMKGSHLLDGVVNMSNYWLRDEGVTAVYDASADGYAMYAYDYWIFDAEL